MEKIVPLIRCEIALCQYVCELVFGFDILDLDFGAQVDSVKQPFKRNSVGPGYGSHFWTSALDDHLHHRFIIFKNVKHRTGLRRIQRLRKHNRRCIIQDCCAELESWFGSWLVFLMMCHAAGSLNILFGFS